jgi:hypothetical protein
MSYKKYNHNTKKIYSYFKSTTEPFNFLEWDGKNLVVWNKSEIIEQYSSKKLAKLVFERI